MELQPLNLQIFINIKREFNWFPIQIYPGFDMRAQLYAFIFTISHSELFWKIVSKIVHITTINLDKNNWKLSHLTGYIYWYIHWYNLIWYISRKKSLWPCNLDKITSQLYLNHTWLSRFSREFPKNFQAIFSKEY